MSSVNNYDLNVRRIAEILAGENFPGWAMSKLDTSDSCRMAWDIAGVSQMSKAKLMVAEMAEIHEKGFREGLRRANDGMGNAPSRNDQLFKIGLISQEQWEHNERMHEQYKVVQSGDSPSKTDNNG